MHYRAFLAATFLLITGRAFAADPDPVDSTAALAVHYEALWKAYADSILFSFDYQTGTIELDDGLATLTVPDGYTYIPEEDARTLFVDLWNNPPDFETLGVLLPEASPTFDSLTYAVDIRYVVDGYVSDDDAAELDYDELLEIMQASAEEGNPVREKAGYAPVHLTDWATEPRYDAERHRLYFAKELQFEDEASPTLNYNVQFLNRYGYINYNVIGEMDHLPLVDEKLEEILASVEFNEGYRYADFDSSMDRVAAYGIGGLIAGKFLAKAGVLSTIGIFLAKGWKLVLFALLACGGFVKKLFAGAKASA